MTFLFDKTFYVARSRDIAVVLFLGAFPFMFYWPVLLGQQVFYANDIFRLFYPLQTELGRALAEGRLPLWTPYLQAGFPLFAEGEIAALYPINWIFHALLPVSTELSYSILFHFAWASIGMFFLGRSVGLRTSSALLAGFCFGFSGFMTAHLQHAPHLAVGSWMPWLVFLQQKYWQARSCRQNTLPWFLLSSSAIAVQWFGGFPQMALINVAVFALLGIFGPWVWRNSFDEDTENRTAFSISQFAQAVVVPLSAIVIGTGLAAIQLLPTLELIGFSIRGQDLGQGFFTSFSLDPSALTQFVSPFARLGAPDTGNMEYWAYLGILPLFLAFLAPILRRKPQTWVFLLLALVSISLALGESNPIYNWLYYVPVFNRFRVPARFLLPFTFAVSFLAAIGFQELLKRLRETSNSTRVSIVSGAAIALGAVGSIGLGYALPLESWMPTWQWLPLLLIVLSTAVILAAWLRLIKQDAFKFAAILLAVLDLIFFSIPFLDLNRTVPPSDVLSVPRTVQAMDRAQSTYRTMTSRPPASGTAARVALWPNFSLQYAKQGIGIYAPLEFQRVHEYVDEMTPTMRDLINERYYLLPLETASQGDPSPFDETEPEGGLTPSLLAAQPSIPLTQVAGVQITSYTDQTGRLPNGLLVGELVLGLSTGEKVTLPIRLGIETGDWDFDAISRLGPVAHDKPAGALSFPAYLSSVGEPFEGHRYVARYPTPGAAPWTVETVGARTFLPAGGLTIEQITLIDLAGKRLSLSQLLHRNDLSLVFRSQAAAMWENQDVLPRGFLVHHAASASDGQTLSLLRQADFRPDQIVLLNDAQPMSQVESGTTGYVSDQVAIARYLPERVVVNLQADKAGYLVLTDSWYPGWVATVDGKEAPIYRADYIFRAVALTEGRHEIVFEYKPMSLVWGAVVTGLSVCVCIILALALRSRSRQQKGEIRLTY